MMTAHDYMGLYRNLRVPIVNEKDERTGWQTVDVHQYLLTQQDSAAGSPEHYNVQNATSGLGTLESKIRDHFSKKGASLKVFVGTAEVDERTFQSANDVWYFARKAFFGKGSPEEVQITLQLVLRFGLEVPARLQAYCDVATDVLAQGRVGLDCNGFVGNYLDHGFHDKAWDADKIGFSNYTANTGVKDIMDRMGPEVKSLDDIGPLQLYAMGLVDPVTKQVINRVSGSHTAHCVVTTPFTLVGMLGNKAYIQMQVVESTLDKGLTESDYLLLSGSHSVFEVRRGSKVGTPFERMSVRMRPLK